MWLKQVLRAEEGLIRIETWLLVVCVVVMLALSSYNVFYRNLLVPWQKNLATSGPPVAEVSAPPPSSPTPEAKPDKAQGDAAGFGGGFGGGDGAEQGDAAGFGGGFGADEGQEGAQEDAAGFGGGFGDSEGAQEEPQEEPEEATGGFGGGFGGDGEEPQEAAQEAEGDDEGFGGGFGAQEPEGEGGEGFGGGFGTQEGADSEEGGFGGGFGGGEEPEAAPAEEKREAVALVPQEPEGGPPPEGSTAAALVELIDTIKLDWIDILLRQLVIIVGFLGAMLATRRKKHINIDAASKLLPLGVQRVTTLVVNLVVTVVCVVLASAGWNLVSLSLEFPKELMSWADEWTFQLMFPVGFGLLALHFLVRVLEDIERIRLKAPMPLQGEAAEAAEAAEAVRASGGAS